MDAIFYFLCGIVLALGVAATFCVFIWLLSKTKLSQRVIELLSVGILLLALSLIVVAADIIRGVIYAASM